MVAAVAHPLRQIRTLGDVKSGLKELGFPSIQNAALQAIAAVEQDTFRSALLACINNADPNGQQRQYLEALLCCLTTPAIHGLNQLGIQVDYGKLVSIGKQSGKRFRGALAAAIDSNNERHMEGKALVFQMLRLEMTQAAQRSAEVYQLAPGKAHIPDDADTQDQTATQQRPTPSRSASVQDTEQTDRNFKSVHVYGGKSALCFNASETKKKVATINIDAAAANGEKSYDWQGAIHLQLTPKELPMVYAVLVNWLPKVEFNAHGAANDKSFSIERQQGKFFARVAMKDNGVKAVQIGVQDAEAMALLFLEQMIKGNPSIPPEILLQTTRAVCTIEAGK